MVAIDHSGTPTLQIADVVSQAADVVVVAVRCLSGPARLHTRFEFVWETSRRVDLLLTRIEWYGRDVDTLDQAHTARVTFSGRGADSVGPGDTLQAIP